MNYVLGSAFKLIGMLLAEGSLEILEALSKNEVVHFKDFRKLKNERTDKTFSANTLSARLKELEQISAITKIVSVTDKGRSAVAYKITLQGTKALQISKKYEVELSKFLHEPEG